MNPVPTLSINVGDNVLWNGLSYVISAVGSAVLNATGDRYTYALTTTKGIISASANNLVLSSKNAIGTQFWVYSS